MSWLSFFVLKWSVRLGSILSAPIFIAHLLSWYGYRISFAALYVIAFISIATLRAWMPWQKLW